MISRFPATIEALETRIAPAVVFSSKPLYPLPDIDAGAGQTGAVVDLSKMFDSEATSPNRTLVTFHTNFDLDPNTDGIQGGDITIELYDDWAPLTVQNFLRYALNTDENGNYEGTFFHRLVQGFVLQGGGFQLDGKTAEHVETFDEVHNEFDRVLRSNVRGTVALAKTGLGPNTGTSEWFINLADNNNPNNPDSLDNQNGGFTVFGHVIDKPNVVDGMELIDKIAALPTATGIVGDFPTPIQNYVPGKPFKVNSNNVVTITDVTVQPSSGGNSEGITYQYEIDSDLFDTTKTGLNGNQLNLVYAAGKSGVAEVKIKATKGDQTIEETFQVTVLPNLISHIQSDGFNTTIIPGQTASVVFDIANTGGAAYQGDVEVNFFLAKYKKVSTNSSGGYRYDLITPYERVPLDTITYHDLALATGNSQSETKTLTIPTDIFADSGTVFQVFAEVVPKNGTERFTDDNFALEGNKHQLYNQFGSYNTADAGPVKDAVLSYTEADGDVVTFSIKGPGFGKVVKAADGSIDLELTGTTAKTKVFATVTQSGTGDGDFVLRNLDAKGPLGTVQFDHVDVRGGLAFTSGVKVVQFDDILGPSTLSISEFAGAKGTQAKLSFGSIHDLTLDSLMPIASLTATEWLDTTGEHDALNVISLKSLNITGDSTASTTVRGDFQADLNITSSAKVNTIRVAGVVKDSIAHIYGNVGSVSLGGLEDSSFLVGAVERPDSITDFTVKRTVSSFKISTGGVFENSTVAAARFNNIVLNGVDTDSSTTDFGVVADAIKSYNRDGHKFANLSKPNTYDSEDKYLIRIV